MDALHIFGYLVPTFLAHRMLTNQDTARLARVGHVRCIHERDPSLADELSDLADGYLGLLAQLTDGASSIFPQVFQAGLIVIFYGLDTCRAYIMDRLGKHLAAARTVSNVQGHAISPLNLLVGFLCRQNPGGDRHLLSLFYNITRIKKIAHGTKVHGPSRENLYQKGGPL